MPVAAADYFRGAALSLIIGHPAYASLQPLGQGRFLINGALRVWLRHSKEKSPWHFSFSPGEAAALGQDRRADGKVFLCLVCGRDSICALNAGEIGQALAMGGAEEQTLTVTRVPGRKLKVQGPAGEVDGVILASAFPDKLFA